jgi:predicted transposase/invertase (TIGR01784 family)
VYNINRGHNPELAKRSVTLNGYEIFTGLVREYEKESKNLGNAVKLAINECIKRNILKEYLESNSSEIRNMLLQEWDWKIAEKVWREEGREEGIEEGVAKGKAEIAKNLKTMGIDVNTIAKSTGISVDEILKL